MFGTTLIFFVNLISLQALASPALSFSKEWLKLNHYKKNILSGYESQILGDEYFLHPQGKTRPDLELEETIKKMSDPQIQCKYISRRQFLIEKGLLDRQKIVRCSEIEDWIDKLGAQKISLIFASAYMNSAGSSFGHTFLKFSNNKNLGAMELVDYGVNYSARTDNYTGALYALKGLFGYFPGQFALLPYHQLIKEYTNLEGRDIWEYELNFNELEIKKILYHLREIEQGYFDYYFLDENCSQLILKLFEIARPELELTNEDDLYVIPIETVKLISRRTNLIVGKKFRPSLLTIWEQQKNQLTVHEREQLSSAFENEIDINELNTRTMDAGLSYLSYAGKNDTKYSFSKVRSQRKDKFDFTIIAPEKSPEQGLDSSMVSLGASSLNQFTEGQLKFQFAFHDLLSNDVGASPWSQLKVFEFDLRSGQQNNRKSYLRKFTVIDFLSTQAIDEFSIPKSWGVGLGIEQNLWQPKDHLGLFLHGRYGLSVEVLPTLRFLIFLVAMTEEDPQLRYQLGSGGEINMVYKNNHGLSVQTRFQSLRMSDAALKTTVDFELSRQLFQQSELRLQFSEVHRGQSEQEVVLTERIVRLAMYFQF